MQKSFLPILHPNDLAKEMVLSIDLLLLRNFSSQLSHLIICCVFLISRPFSIAVVIDCAYIIGLYNSIVKKKDKFFYQ